MALLLLSSSMLWAQAPAREVRSESVYHARTQQLIEKYEYYYDYWSEQEIKHGRYNQWNPEGQLIERAYYHHGKLTGTYEKYFSNGQLKERLLISADGTVMVMARYRRNGKSRKS